MINNKLIIASIKESDDPQIPYLMAAWARICKILGKDFIPYLSIVIPPLLESAKKSPEVALIDSMLICFYFYYLSVFLFIFFI